MNFNLILSFGLGFVVCALATNMIIFPSVHEKISKEYFLIEKPNIQSAPDIVYINSDGKGNYVMYNKWKIKAKEVKND